MNQHGRLSLLANLVPITSLQVDAYQAAELLPAFLDQPTVDGFNSFAFRPWRQQGLKVVLSLGGMNLGGCNQPHSAAVAFASPSGPLRPHLPICLQHPSHRNNDWRRS